MVPRLMAQSSRDGITGRAPLGSRRSSCSDMRAKSIPDTSPRCVSPTSPSRCPRAAGKSDVLQRSPRDRVRRSAARLGAKELPGSLSNFGRWQLRDSDLGRPAPRSARSASARASAGHRTLVEEVTVERGFAGAMKATSSPATDPGAPSRWRSSQPLETIVVIPIVVCLRHERRQCGRRRHRASGRQSPVARGRRGDRCRHCHRPVLSVCRRRRQGQAGPADVGPASWRCPAGVPSPSPSLPLQCAAAVARVLTAP